MCNFLPAEHVRTGFEGLGDMVSISLHSTPLLSALLFDEKAETYSGIKKKKSAGV